MLLSGTCPLPFRLSEPEKLHNKFLITANASFPLSQHLRRLCKVNKSYSNGFSRISAKSAKSERNTQSTETTSVFENEDSAPQNSVNQSTSFLSVLCPLLNLLSASDPSQERNTFLEVATSSLSTLARLPWGSRSIYESLQKPVIAAKDPPMHLQLFEFEACPFCRRVREAMTELDLSVEVKPMLTEIGKKLRLFKQVDIQHNYRETNAAAVHLAKIGGGIHTDVYPCPKGSTRHREVVKQLGGKEQYPFLLDPNSGVSMYESGDIVKYLFLQYGQSRSPSVGLLESTLFTGWVPTILRAGRGMSLWKRARKDPPPKMLELFSYENNPYARIVREALCELELPYILHNVGKGSMRSALLLQTSGFKEVPYLIDPNTGTQLGDHQKILKYLFQTYSTAA